MENEGNKILEQAGESLEYAKQYISNQKNLLKLEIAERTAKVASSLVLVASVAVLGLLVIGFLSVAAAFFIGDTLESTALGFTIVGGFYLFSAVVIFWLRERLLINPVLSRVIKSFFD